MSDVIEINNLDQLAGYRLLWNRLLPETPRASFFHSMDWLDTYWRHFGHDQKLRVLIVHSDGQPIGIVPFCVRTQTYRIGRVRVLGYPLDNWGNWYGPIGPNQAACMMRAMQHVRNTPRDWDLIDLRWTGPATIDGGRPGRAMTIAGFKPHKAVGQTMSVVDLSGTWSQYLASKSSKCRTELRRTLRRVFDRQDAEFIRHRPAPARAGDGDARWDLFDMCQTIAAASWQASSTNGNTLSTNHIRSFVREAHHQAARMGMLDLILLLVGGQPAAYFYNYCVDGRVTGLRTGYDPDLGGSGCGIALLLRTIQDGFQRGDRSIDLGVGDQVFKQRVRTGTESSLRFTHSPLCSWRSQAVKMSQWAKRRLGRRDSAAWKENRSRESGFRSHVGVSRVPEGVIDAQNND